NEAQAQATAASGRGDGRYSSGLHDGAETSTASDGQTKAEVPLTTEAVITRENLMLAYQRVVELKPSLKKNRFSVRQALTDGNYQP
ncbi:maturase, partial [Escherichia coli]|nr:maturase [Escherichia coli]